ncbi:SDR family oxidoreductase [Geitlerinema splendidum]|nr:SDR family oxidoreductase [Geitlerinema splendidum]
MAQNDIGAEHFAEFYKPIWDVDLERGLRLLRLAIDTHLITSHFALPLLIQKPGGLVVELTDGTADYNNGHYRQALIYDVAKNAIIRMAWALAQELQSHSCTAVCLTPGWLRSEMMLDSFGVSEKNWQDATAKEPHFIISETPRYVGRAVAHLAGDSEVARWNGQSLSSGQLAKVYGFTDLDGSQPDAWRYIQEVTEMGKAADPTGYR